VPISDTGPARTDLGDFHAQRSWAARPTVSGCTNHQLQKIAAADKAISGQARRKSAKPRSRLHHSTSGQFASHLSVCRACDRRNGSTMAFVQGHYREIVLTHRMALINCWADRTNRAVVVPTAAWGTSIATPPQPLGRVFFRGLHREARQPTCSTASIPTVPPARLRRPGGARIRGGRGRPNYDKNGRRNLGSILRSGVRE